MSGAFGFGYGSAEQLPCRCGAWYGPTEESQRSHQIVFGHRPVPAAAPALTGTGARPDTDDEGQGEDA